MIDSAFDTRATAEHQRWLQRASGTMGSSERHLAADWKPLQPPRLRASTMDSDTPVKKVINQFGRALPCFKRFFFPPEALLKA